MSLKRILLTTVAVTLPLLAAWLCASCSGCSGRHEGGSGAGNAADTAAVQATPEVILEAPAVLDEQALRSYANAIAAGNPDFTAADMARMIRLAEGALNRLGQETERLELNGDPADSFNVLSELASRRWPGDACTIIAFLRTVPLGAEMQPHADQLVRTAARITATLDAIAEDQHGGRHYLSLDVEPHHQ